MSWVDGLLVGFGTGLRSAGRTYFDEKDKRARREQAALEREDRRTETMDELLRRRDEFDERKRSNRAQEQLERERNVQSSMDRMLARENARYAADEATRRAVETALIRAETARTRPTVRPQGTRASANPDGMTQTQRDGLMIVNREWLPGERQEMLEMQRLWRQAREAFPDAHPGDVAMAAKRMYDRIKREQSRDRY